MSRPVLISILASLVLIAGCGSKSSQAVSTNPQVQQNVAQAQKIVQGCLSKGNVLTSAGRQAILQCIAPPGHLPAFEQCAQQALSKGVLTPGQRRAFYQALAVCLQQNR